MSEFAVGRMAGKDGKQHGAPHFRGEFARMEEVGQKEQRTNHVQKCPSNLPMEDMSFINNDLEYGGGGGSRTRHRC